jgi:GntR family transcriptional regulator
MDFFIEGHSQLAADQQIQEQVKLALLLGQLRPGDTLPSIRDVQKQAGISPNVVRKAYRRLQLSGVLTLRHGKGALIAKGINYRHDSRLLERCEKLAKQTIVRVRKTGISSTAFARYLYQMCSANERETPAAVYVDATKSLAVERALKIASVLQTNIPGLSLEALGQLESNGSAFPSIILTNYYRLDQVRKMVTRRGTEVIPLGLSFAPSMLEDFRRLPPKAAVVLVLADEDYPSLSLILAGYRKILVSDTVNLRAVPFSGLGSFRKLLAQKKYNKIIISNRIWSQIPAPLRRDPRVTRPLMDIDLASLECVRIKAGFIV